MARKGERSAERIEVTCPCGKVFTVTRRLYKAGRGRRCSKQCQYKYMERPSGLKYTLTKVNPASFKPGEHRSPATEFKPGQEAWNKGRPSGRVPSSAFRPGQTAGEANARWAGDRVRYGGLHIRVYKERGSASAQQCAHADATCKGQMHWANISGRYESTEDFMPLCQSHHRRYDLRENIKPNCAEPGCDRLATKRGYCHKDYSRRWRRGEFSGEKA